jgi:hypothetical protein
MSSLKATKRTSSLKATKRRRGRPQSGCESSAQNHESNWTKKIDDSLVKLNFEPVLAKSGTEAIFGKIDGRGRKLP